MNDTANRPSLSEVVARAQASSATDPTWRTDYSTPRRQTRVHYVPDCPAETGQDTLAVTVEEGARVNCPECLAEMKDMGVL